MLFNIDEKQLMLELKNKDERALKICMNKYYRYVVYIVENIIGSALPYEDKEEVVSNVFVALWNYSAGIIELVYIVLQSVVKPGITGFFKIDLHIKCYIYLS
ncbi:hypothetical protein G4412_00795 [Coprococcus comes]|uniref:hypothetical protein n=1 Tax=Coprococcus comes TaxID=410072 RepID=UPI00156D6335|nr:hypothetical protein [Coprococcus comes]NSC14559.1 hypothetical protein [Coprococcus comes]NSC17592.1 hypothetical protein [Coprococcus comes]NSC28898.1 hypothetical protein [Coprococcus comes]NSC66410.1 hypothetical protein [Coprococcus comes]NSC86119.1 hypothetical protein [Coprococcus comes]